MTIEKAYLKMRKYFSRPGAVLGKGTSGPGLYCQYRTTEGNKCAVGCLIPDKLYDALLTESNYNLEAEGSLGRLLPALEERLNAGENGNLQEFAEIIGLDDPDLFEFLRGSQSLHDSLARDAQHFVRLLDVDAQARGLPIPA